MAPAKPRPPKNSAMATPLGHVLAGFTGATVLLVTLSLPLMAWASPLTHALSGLKPAPSQMVSEAIYNGSDISDEPLDHAPLFFAKIENLRSDNQIGHCSGTAIAPDIVLTAGHCLINAKEVSVHFISKLSPLTFETIPAKAWKVHPNYNGGFPGKMFDHFESPNYERYHDIALIFLRSSSKYAEPATFAPRDFDPLAEPNWLFVFGQGRSDDYRIKGNLEFLRLTSLYRISQSTVYRGRFAAEQGWCVRDSGGPVTVGAQIPGRDQRQHFLVGVASAYWDTFVNGDKTALQKMWGSLDQVPNCGKSFGFFSVLPDLPWIERTISEVMPTTPRHLQIFDNN